MSEETTAVAEPEDDAIVVQDEAAEEKAHDELVADVAKMLDSESTPEQAAGETGEGEKEKPPKAEKPKDEKPEEPEGLSQELQTRAEGAGISKELAERLHQTGHLEETLTAFDRTLIERFQSKETEDVGKQPERREQKPPQKEDQEDVPDLDPDVYDEDLVKRDAYHKQRIDALEAKVEELLGERQGTFDKRFDSMVDELGHEELFGKGDSPSKDKQANRDKLFKAYGAICNVYDVDPADCDPQWVHRALAAMFPSEVAKQAQRQTVDRLRDAEGKFLTKSKTRGAPPSKDTTDEEVHEQLVSDVSTYLKKQGVQMSGV